MKKEKEKTKEIKKPEEQKETLFQGVKREMSKVRWPLRKEMVKYSISVFGFIIFFGLFFMLADFIIAAVKVWVS